MFKESLNINTFKYHYFYLIIDNIFFFGDRIDTNFPVSLVCIRSVGLSVNRSFR